MGNFFRDIGADPLNISSMFDREHMEAPVRLQEPWQIEMQQYLANLAKPGAAEALTTAGQPYPGPLTTSYEDVGLKGLGEYLTSPSPVTSETYKSMTDWVNRVLTGESGEERYEADKLATMRRLNETADWLARRSSRENSLFGGTYGQNLARLAEGENIGLAQRKADYDQWLTELGARAVPIGQQVLGWAEQVPLTRVAASQEYGGLPFQRGYSEYVRQLASLGIPLEVASKLAMYTPEHYQPGYEPSAFEQYVMPLLQAAASGAGRAAVA